MEEQVQNKIEIIPKTKKEIEKIIETLVSDGLRVDDVDLLYKLIDIHKDIENECYWKIKEDNMRYYTDDYYDGGRSRDSQGRYIERGYNRRYRGEDVLDRMHDDYRDYSYGRENYRGNTTQSLEYMMKSVADFVGMLQDDAGSQEELDIIKKYSRKISEM